MLADIPRSWSPAVFPAEAAAARRLEKWLGNDCYNLNGMERDFRGADLTGADLVKANLDEAVLRSVVLDGADMVGARGGQVQVIPPRRPAVGTP
ncbi:pentapeptide repeat-containing protein [Streptomyces sp. NPDC097595]|uniref:pentapeptide repeat-containing protein n=1 Tax=Streptomyces sp. NPDC097595 TaxID=3366090 RepID=UPI00380C05A3